MLKKFLLLLTFFYAAMSFAAVDANQASAAELDGIKGIGPAISSKILDERKKGSFKDWNDFISRVNGLGQKNAAKFSAQGLTVNGSAYTGAPAPAAKDKKATGKLAADSKTAAPAAAPAPVPAAAPTPAAAPATAPAPSAPAAVKK